MGRSTYEPALKAGLEHPYTPLPTVVFSRSLPARTEGSLRITGEDPMQVVRALKGSATRDIWLCGGAKLASQLVPLVDELLLKVNPVLVHRATRAAAPQHAHVRDRRGVAPLRLCVEAHLTVQRSRRTS